MLNEEPRTKPWPVRETQKLARQALEVAPQSMAACWRANIKLLLLHRESMIPYSERWLRVGATIRNLEAQD